METFLSNLTGKEKNKMIRKLYNFDFFYIYLFLLIFAKEKSFIK